MMEQVKNNEHRLTAVEDRAKSNTRRIDDLEKRQDNLDELVSSVKVLAYREQAVENDVAEIKKDVKSIKAEPGKRWTKVVETLIVTVVAAIIGFALGKIGL